ncbi:host specificity protein J [Kluyvera cryocrescens]|uniref:host specificity protein J n=1 Tax=Kluyvera cryocrescens TaxID=580 RepID=UPI00155E70C3|nr:host specificity protein J [Kluyvera cryocrescens]
MAPRKITGQKGGSSKSRTPTEQPDDLQSVAKAKLLVALGEGEYAGALTGKDIYLDGTPLENADGSQNFGGVVWEFRSGTQAQQYIQGIPGTENEISVGTEISSATAWTRTFTNTLLSAVRLRIKWPSIYKQQDNGDLVGYTINYAIDLQTDGGAFQTVINTSVTGKTTSGYERSHRINLPPAGSTWTVRLRKTTADANSAKVGDTMTLQSYTEVIDAKLRYPNTALLYIEFDSSQFNGSIPQISCEPKMRVIRVPDNYDPETRSYLGTWTGAFKWAWTDNPAWVFYDLVLSDRFGLGNRLTAANIDKWSLYEVAQYCDQMVPDGKGGSGTEPRYTCNVYVQDRNDAYTVLRDFAAIFRGMTYWGGDQIVALADMPRDIDFSYTRANVIDGLFTYASSTTKTRYTTALVSWSDPDNAYADAMEPVFEQQLVARYGFNQLEMTAIGCTRQSEANRKGRWGILTNNKDRVVTFSVGLDGNIPQPGYIIAVADELLSGKVTGGRIRSVNGRVIELDRVADAAAGNRLILNLPSGAAQSRTIQAINGNKITVTTAFSETPEAECVWVVESDELYAQQYRVVSVSDNNDGTFTISGAAHDPDKYARIDTGAIIDQRPVSVIPPGNQSAPDDIEIGSYSVVQQGLSVETMRVTWSVVDNAIAYEAQWRRNDGNWVNVPRSSTTSFEVESIYAGRYLVRVRAINAAEISSGWGYSEEATLTGKVGNPPKPVGFAATGINWGIQLNWGFPANTADTLKTEIQYTANSDQSDPMLLSDVPYPSSEYIQLGLKAGQEFWYRAQLVDKTGNESGWTDWLRGMSNDNADDYLGDIADDFLTSKDGDALTSQIDQNIEGILQNALANNATIEHQWAQYGEVRADILIVKTTIAEVDNAMAELSTTVQAELGDMTASLEDKLTAVVDADGASAIHTLKVGVRIDDVYYGAGMSVAVVAEAGQPVVTRIGFNANQFVLLSGEGDAQFSPFAVINGQAFLSEAIIRDASITNAKIGQYIRSSNWVPGEAGWNIDKNGDAEFNNVTSRGTIYGTDGWFKGTVYANRIEGDIYTLQMNPRTIPPSTVAVNWNSWHYYNIYAYSGELFERVIDSDMVLRGVNSPEYIEIILELVLEDGTAVKQVGYSYTNGGQVPQINLSGYTIPATATREARVILRMAVKTPRSTQTQFQFQVSGTRVAASRAGRVVIA